MTKKKMLTCITAFVGIMILILDAKTAFNGALEGIHLCVRVVIPSIFPMLFLTIILSGTLGATNASYLRKIGKICKMPNGSEQLLLLGLISGYPVGAQCIADAYHNKQLTRFDAHRLLGFCSNAGPSFIFGMVASLFSSKSVVFIIWLVHITSALICSLLLPYGTQENISCSENNSIGITKAVEKSAKSIMLICAWVILFRTVIAFLQRWFLWILPEDLSSVIIGLLEISNGIYMLNSQPLTGMRFVMSAVFLSFGGLCVYLQTASVTSGLGTGYYFPGKLLQACISFFICYVLQYLLFPIYECWQIPLYFTLLPLLTCVTITIVLRKRKNSSISNTVDV